MDFEMATLAAELVGKNGWKLVELHREPPHLENVFRRLTGGPEGVLSPAAPGGEA